MDETPSTANARPLEMMRRAVWTPKPQVYGPSVRFSGEEKTDPQMRTIDLAILMPRKEENSTVNPLVGRRD
jgi:hypothetical protein